VEKEIEQFLFTSVASSWHVGHSENFPSIRAEKPWAKFSLQLHLIS